MAARPSVSSHEVFNRDQNESTHSGDFTVPSSAGSNIALVALVHSRAPTDAHTFKYDDVALDRVGSLADTNRSLSAHVMHDPPTDQELTWELDTGGDGRAIVGLLVCVDVDPETPSSGWVTSDAFVRSIATGADDLAIGLVVVRGGNTGSWPSLAPLGTGQTQIYTAHNGAPSGARVRGAGDRVDGTGGEVTFEWEDDGDFGWVTAAAFLLHPVDEPDPPTDFQVTEEAAHHIDVSWTDQTDGEHPHRLYIRETGEQWEIAGEAPAGEEAFRYDFLESGTSYELGITSFDGDLESEMVTTTGTTAAIILTPNSLTHAQSFDESALSQLHTLTAVLLSHTQSLGALALAQSHGLTLDQLQHAQTLDTTALSIIYSLTAEALSHTQTLAESALEQIHALTLSALSHTQTLDAATLSQIHDLTANALTHTQTLSTTELLQLHGLVVNDLLHAQTLEEITLAIEGVLNVSSLIHAQTLDQPSLTQDHGLTLEDLQHVQTLDTIAIEVASQLLINNLQHSQTLDTVSLERFISLAADALTHPQTLDSLALSQIHNISTQDLQHTQDLNTTSLTQLAQLLLESLSHDQTLSLSELSQAHTLSASDLLHTHSLSEPILVRAVELIGRLIAELQNVSREVSLSESRRTVEVR